MLSIIRILIENTPRSVTMPDAMTRRDRYVCSVWAHNLLQMGSPNSHITPWVVFYATGIVLLLYRPINRFYILTAAEGR